MSAALLDLFAEPSAGLALGALPIFAWVLWTRHRRRSRRLATVVGRRADALASERATKRNRLRVWLGLAGLGMCVLAWMQPRFGTAAATRSETRTDVCVCLDVSRSMLARDLQPSRLHYAHGAIAELAQRTRGDRLALVLFAGEARLRVPLTRDVESFVEIARSTDPVDVPLGGTRIEAAIDAAVRALGASADQGGQKSGTALEEAPMRGAIVLVTDGEDLSGSGRAAAERARARGLSVHCVGLGSALGSKITVTGAGGRETFLRDRSGQEVVSRMDPASLRAVATAGGGVFVDAGARREPLVHVYERGIIPTMGALAGRPEDGSLDGAAGRANRYQLPLSVGVSILLIEFALAERRRRRRRFFVAVSLAPAGGRT